jgi:putative hemolysin
VSVAVLRATDTALRSSQLTKGRRDEEEDEENPAPFYQLRLSTFEPINGIKFAEFLLGTLIITFLNVWLVPGFSERLNNHFELSPGASQVVAAILIAVPTVFILLTFIIVLPTLAVKRNLECFSKILFPLGKITEVLFRYPARFVSCLSKKFALFLVKQGVAHDEQITEDEIRMMVDVGEEKGTIEESERDMIENVFEFNNMTAEECMTHRTDMVALWLEDTEEQLLETIKESGLSRFPVYTDDLDHIIGIMTTRDYLMNRLSKQPRPLKHLLRKPYFVPESIRTDALFRKMQNDKAHMAIVVDEYGGTSGIITMEDLLEQIVGNIYDEYDPQIQADMEKVGDTWKVAGYVELERFNEETGFQLPVDDEYDTVGGFLLSRLSYIPEDGTQVDIEEEGLMFTIKEIEDRRIEWVEVKKIDG